MRKGAGYSQQYFYAIDPCLRTAGLFDSKRFTVLQINVGQQITLHAYGQLVVDIGLLPKIEGTIDILQQTVEDSLSFLLIEAVEHRRRTRYLDTRIG